MSVSDREYLESRIDNLAKIFEMARIADKEAIRIASDAAEKALVKAQEAQDARLALLNESRRTIEDQGSKFATKETVGALEKLANINSEKIASIEGRFLAISSLAALISIFGGIYIYLK